MEHPHHYVSHFTRDDAHTSCALCKRDIYQPQLFYECTFCRLRFCTLCTLSHPPSHEHALVTLSSNFTRFEENSETETCRKCCKATFFRYSCRDCDYCLCRGCWYDQSFNVHEHKWFKVFELKHKSGSRSTSPKSCCKTASVSHCHDCSTPFSIGQEAMFCQTCYIQTNDPVYFCHACYIAADRSHQHDHKICRWAFQVAQPNQMAGISCRDCGRRMQSILELKDHPHTNFIDVYSEVHLNQVVAKSYRQCRNKDLRTDQTTNQAFDQCTMCQHGNQILSILRCGQCSTELKLCPHCKQNAIQLHIHLIQTYNPVVNVASVATPPLGQPNTHIPYPQQSNPNSPINTINPASQQTWSQQAQQIQIRSQTASPTSAVPLSHPQIGQQSMIDPSRRTSAATGTVKPPQVRPAVQRPAQRISQPVQKKRETASGIFMKTMAKTQKNALTKFATKVAVGTLSNVILGSDVSDSFDFGDAGSSDMLSVEDVGIEEVIVVDNDMDPSDVTLDDGCYFDSSSTPVDAVDTYIGASDAPTGYSYGGSFSSTASPTTLDTIVSSSYQGAQPISQTIISNGSSALTGYMTEQMQQQVYNPQIANSYGDPSMLSVSQS